MRDKLNEKTGSAQIKHVGQTASNQHGSDPSVRVKGRSEARVLKAK